MTKSEISTVDGYIAAQPAVARPVLERVRRTIRKALPGAEEVISYKMPAYKLHGGIVVYFAGWKRHFSLYPASERLVGAFRGELAPDRVSRGTIRFPLSESVPVDLIKRMVRFRASELAQRNKAGTLEG